MLISPSQRNRRLVEVGRGRLRPPGPAPAQVGSTRRPVGLGIAPQPQPLQPRGATGASVGPPSEAKSGGFVFRWNLLVCARGLWSSASPHGRDAPVPPHPGGSSLGSLQSLRVPPGLGSPAPSRGKDVLPHLLFKSSVFTLPDVLPHVWYKLPDEDFDFFKNNLTAAYIIKQVFSLLSFCSHFAGSSFLPVPVSL